jgi:hypothetical protein
MAPQAQAALFVERQGCNVVRVIARRTVTVFALNSFVRRTPMFLYIVLMTLETRLIALILDWKNRPEPGIAWQTKSVRPVRLQATMGARHAASLSPVPVPLGTRKVNFDFDDVRFKV